MIIDILSLFPPYFKGPFDESIIGQARKKGILTINLINIRDFAKDKHHRVDDRPFGGGPGMVLMPGPVVEAVRSVKTVRDEKVEDEKTIKSHAIYLTPQGAPLTAAKCRQLASYEHLVLLCGHYEGVDERAIESVIDEEISIGDYVLTNGCLAAIVLVDALVRFVPGVLGHPLAANEDSFEKGPPSKSCGDKSCGDKGKSSIELKKVQEAILDCPHYTKPVVFEGKAVPEVLLSGHHQKIQEWKNQEALKRTKERRPDLIKKNLL